MKKEQLRDRLLEFSRETIKKKEVLEKDIDRLLSEIYSEMKVCSYECERLLPATTEYFARHPNTKDGLQSNCRDCGNLMTKRKALKEKEQELLATDYVENAEDLDYQENEKELDFNG